MKPKLLSDVFVDRWNREQAYRRGPGCSWLTKKQLMFLLSTLSRKQQRLVRNQFRRAA